MGHRSTSKGAKRTGTSSKTLGDRTLHHYRFDIKVRSDHYSKGHPDVLLECGQLSTPHTHPGNEVCDNVIGNLQIGLGSSHVCLLEANILLLGERIAEILGVGSV